MFAPVVLIIFAILVVSRQAPLDDEELKGMFMECSKTQGLIDALFEKDADGSIPETEMHCTFKCFYEKVGAISGGKFVLDKLEEGPMKKCLEQIEIKECSDIAKFFLCEQKTDVLRSGFYNPRYRS